jgi:acetyl-CoA carboxylase biotin carboxyl carrier protein
VTLTAKDVAEITRLLEESSFDELYLELDGVKLSLKRNGTGARAGTAAGFGSTMPSSAGTVAPAAAASLPRQAAPASSQPPAPAGTPAAGAADPNVHGVSSPLLGTYYRAPKPGAPPYVEVGSMVEEDTIVGIIEVMKLMNTVRAGARGRVAEILARDGVLVEYGETLLRIAKSG